MRLFLISANSLDEDQYTLVYVFLGTESDFQFSFTPSITVFCKKNAKKCQKIPFSLKLGILTPLLGEDLLLYLETLHLKKIVGLCNR